MKTSLITSWTADLFNLFFPRICAVCKTQLVEGEDALCLNCLLDLPQTGFHLMAENPLQNQFKGRIALGPVVACYYYYRGGKVKTLLEEIKYRGNQEAALAVGRLYGQQLLGVPALAGCDLIVPVPLHSTKLRKRGYNQSEVFAQGLFEVLGIPVAEGLLHRVKKGTTQTAKDRSSRYDDLQDQFVVRDNIDLSGKAILLVDDVITSGATLETCAKMFIKLDATVCGVAIAWTSGE